MYCIYCGKEIPDTAEICISCGRLVKKNTQPQSTSKTLQTKTISGAATKAAADYKALIWLNFTSAVLSILSAAFIICSLIFSFISVGYSYDDFTGVPYVTHITFEVLASILFGSIATSSVAIVLSSVSCGFAAKLHNRGKCQLPVLTRTILLLLLAIAGLVLSIIGVV